MTVCHVNAHYQLGGAETVMRQLHAGLPSKGISSRLCIAHGPRLERTGELSLLYPRVFNRLLYSRFNPVISRIFPPERITDRNFLNLAENDCDILHLHNLGQLASIHSIAALARKKPFLWTFHAYWDTAAERYETDTFSRFVQGIRPQFENTSRSLPAINSDQIAALGDLARTPLWVVAPSIYQADKLLEYRDIHKWNVKQVFNGIDADEFYPSKPKSEFSAKLGLNSAKKTVLVVNRNFGVADKGYDLIREVIRDNLEPDLQWILIGQGAQRAVTGLQSTNTIIGLEFISARDEMANYYKAADYFLFASKNENFPCVILEAMAAACCVIATPTGGVCEQIEDGRTGYLARTISGPALKHAFQTALSSERSDQIGRAASEAVRTRFTEDQMIKGYADVYREMANK